jgi:hypothetical protein
MTTRLPTTSPTVTLDGSHTAYRPVSGIALRLKSVWHSAREILSICSRANIAAHHYEDLKRRSDIDLANMGLTRADLPGAALRKLSEDH